MTGATGFLGRQFLLRYLKSDFGDIYVLVRADSVHAGRERVIRSLEFAAADVGLTLNVDDLRKIRIVVGDIVDNICGINPKTLEIIRENGVNDFWHYAASLKYEDKNKEEIISANLDGTRNALQAALAIRANRFFYISTAYTSGKKTGPIEESLHSTAGPFNNWYEFSKCQAEHEVSNFCSKHSIQYALLRPSVVVGPAATHKCGNNNTGLYGLIEAIHLSANLLIRATAPIRCTGTSDGHINLVPVDYVVNDAIAIRNKYFKSGKVYHLTNSTNFNFQRLFDVITSGCKFSFFLSDNPTNPSGIERFFARRSNFYLQYTSNRKEFIREIAPQPGLSWNDLECYVKNFVDGLYEKDKSNSDFEVVPLKTRNGIDVSAYVMGNGPSTIVLVNAVGMKPEIVLPFARGLSKSHRVITWDLRLPIHTTQSDYHHIVTSAHLRDLQDICSALDIKEATLVSWCTGVVICLHALASQADVFKAGVLLNPDALNSGMTSSSLTAFQTSTRRVLPRIAESMETAEFYYELMFSPTKLIESNEEANLISNFVNLTDNMTLMRLISAPFSSPKAIFNYANTLIEYTNISERNLKSLCNDIVQPVMIYTSKNDTTAHFSNAIELAKMIRGATGNVVVDEYGDHFSHYHNPELASLVDEFSRTNCNKAY
nr:alpha/beta fold hydrolase [Aquitalea sp. LB_tupeE]